MDRLTIIIPVYNHASFIEMCVRSACAQASAESVEVIVVDDGSDDGTGAVLESLYYGGLRVIRLPANGGVARARNIGAAEAKGEYLLFVDSDDELCAGAVTALLEASEDGTMDLVEGAYRQIAVDGTEQTVHQGACCAYLPEEKQSFSGYLWGKLIRRSRYIETAIPDDSIYEDFYVHGLLLDLCNGCKRITDTVYIRRCRQDSLSEKRRRDSKALAMPSMLQRLSSMRAEKGLATTGPLCTFLLNTAGPVAFHRASHLSPEKQRDLFQGLSDVWVQHYASAALPIRRRLRSLKGLERALRNRRFAQWKRVSRRLYSKTLPQLDYVALPSVDVCAYPNAIPVVFASNAHYLPMTAVTLQSIHENLQDACGVDVIILHCGIGRTAQSTFLQAFASHDNLFIRFVNMENWSKRFDFSIQNKKSLSQETYFRLIIPYIMSSEYQKAIYLDSDIIAEKSIRPLYDITFSGELVAAVQDVAGLAEYHAPNNKKKAYRSGKLPGVVPEEYFAASVLVMNIPAIKRNIALGDVLKMVEDKSFLQHDQDILNTLCSGSVYTLALHWNVMQDCGNNQYLPEGRKKDLAEAEKAPSLIHFGGGSLKPWKQKDLVYFDSFWRYAQKTPYAPLLRTALARSMKKKRAVRNVTDEKYFLEIHLTEHCNLGCAGCSHFSPLAQEKAIAPDLFIRDAKAIAPLLDERFQSIHLMGGEPLLHPQLPQILRSARSILGERTIELVTNGLLLTEQPEAFWDACMDSRIIIRVTEYPIELDYRRLETLVQAHGVPYKPYNKPEEPKTFRFMPIDPQGTQDAEENYKKCHMKAKYLLFRDGMLSICSVIGGIDHFNRYFNMALEKTQNDTLDIRSGCGKEAFDLFIQSVPDFCRYCDVAGRRDGLPWRETTCSIKEWTR